MPYAQTEGDSIMVDTSRAGHARFSSKASFEGQGNWSKERASVPTMTQCDTHALALLK